ncbi:formimidoylglutamate deiminase [Edaphobacter bradus]|uniref:formimidoylglutamate deiminase n=1 Tax=Edaphobacter bradus TaxID=2259016 RepID=UPI0021DFC91D|nr:formimidoylglutamate deiminase [Edaphobacter bradus]
MNTFYLPQLLYSDGTFISNRGLLVDESGKVIKLAANPDSPLDKVIELPGKALMPGFVNTHSHSFQRLIRGKSESRIVSGKDFWSWRGTMYYAAAQLNPQEIYDVARMAFLEMVLAGTTTVGEFHYLHTSADGRPYEDPNLLSKQVIAAAQSVGVRIVLLRTAYLRSGYELPRDPGQTRFLESTRDFLLNMDALVEGFPANSAEVRFGVAPHSIRAVPLPDLEEIVAWTRARTLPLHMHVAEQIAENTACVREYGYTPVELLSRNRVLGPDFTAVHSIHISSSEIEMLSQAEATICSCPTTERNLGDGVIAADLVMRAGIRVALGSDSQAQIDPLEDARELDYHLRLRDQERAILDQIKGETLASHLFRCATVNGARALSVPTGEFSPGSFADCFTVDLDDLSIAGHSADDLLPLTVFSLNRSAVRDVIVNGKFIVCNERHPLQNEIVARYKEIHGKVWQNNAVESAHR